MYRLILAESAQKALANLPSSYQELVRDKIDSLAQNPRPHGCKKLQGQTAYRVRQGPYRIIYEIDDSALLVVISRIKSRGEAYR